MYPASMMLNNDIEIVTDLYTTNPSGHGIIFTGPEEGEHFMIETSSRESTQKLLSFILSAEVNAVRFSIWQNEEGIMST